MSEEPNIKNMYINKNLSDSLYNCLNILKYNKIVFSLYTVYILFTISCITFSFSFTYSTRILGLSSIFVFLILASNSYTITFSKNTFLVLILSFLYLVYTLISQIWSTVPDSTFFKNATGLFLNVLPTSITAYILCNKFNKLNLNKFHILILAIQISLVILSLTAIFSSLNDTFRNFFETISIATGNINKSHPQYHFRVRGVLNSAGAGASIIYAFGVVASIHLVNVVKFKIKLYLICTTTLLFWGILLSGRSGLFAIIFYIVLHLTSKLGKLIFNFIVLLKINKKCILYIGFILIFLSIFTFSILKLMALKVEVINIEWLTRDFFLIFNGNLEQGTIKKLINQLILPENISIILWGDASTYLVNRIPTDIGYIRMIWGLGFIGAALYYLLIVIVFYQMFNNCKQDEAKLLVPIFILLIIFEAKEPFLLDLRFTTIIYLMYTFIVIKPKLIKTSQMMKTKLIC